MRIACLAWGSLLWKTGPLRLASGWKDDGPLLPVEFAREGDKGELSTVLLPGAAPQRTWWALLQDDDLMVAREALRLREAIAPDHRAWVGSLPPPTSSKISGPFSGPCDALIADWLRQRPLDAVVWTALPPRHGGVEGRAPTPDEAVGYLDGLRGEEREHARDYVRRVPPSLSTACRQGIEARLGWVPHGGGTEDAS